MTDAVERSGRLLPPTYWFGCALLMVAAHALVPVFRWGSPPATWFGLALFGAAVGLAGWAAWSFRRHDTTVHPFEETTRLVTEGPYHYSRNPMYLGLATALVGLAFILGSLSPILVLPLFLWLITTRFIVPEEHALEAAFGEDFRAWAARVRRWL